MRLKLLAGSMPVALLLASPVSAAARAFPVQTIDPRPAARGDTIAYNAPLPGTDDVRLLVRQAGAPVSVDVPPRRRGFDVALGTDSRGRQVATYTACKDDAIADLGGADGYDLACSVLAVRTVPGARPRVVLRAAKGLTFALPVMANGRLATMVSDGKAIGVAVVGRRRPLRRIGPQRDLDGAPVARGLAFDGRRVVTSWELVHGTCRGEEITTPGGGEFPEYLIETLKMDGTRRILFRDTCPLPPVTNSLGAPSLVGGRVYALGVAARSFLIDVDLRTGRRRTQLFAEPLVGSAVVTSGRLVYSTASATESRYRLRTTRLR